ncbi:Hypothetical predicted protein [Olea europaea subsp. europaea]|uniref:Uncharacterized protein n=1 Tax=Olea europaea subsp. europaea TaxID=158383 RepID=A0A8S0RJX0_OLEEU|nr:Hypothetical predicted protein [Olea europaea subsp. europaea]
MGNCQAAEAATVVIQHPGGNKLERFYWAVSASEVMTSNPGHYVALVITSPVNQLKLLRPDDTLLIGQVYRLITFEDVLKEFAAKKSEKLGKLFKERGALDLEQNKRQPGTNPYSNSILPNGSSTEMRQELLGLGSSTNCGRGVGRHRVGAQWRPSLQSIAEFGT